MTSTKQEQIDRLKAQLERVQEAAGHVAIGHAQQILGTQVAGCLEFSNAYSLDESDDAERVYDFDVRVGYGTDIRGVSVTSTGRVLIDTYRLEVPADLVREHFADALAEEVEEAKADPGRCGYVPPENPDPPPGPPAPPKIPCVLEADHEGEHNHWPFWA